jgi:hypothetical protein
MGAATDEKAVVDPELKFIGIKNLRVADTSVMPAVPSGNSNAATVINLLVRNSNFMKLTRLVCCFIF